MRTIFEFDDKTAPVDDSDVHPQRAASAGA